MKHITLKQKLGLLIVFSICSLVLIAADGPENPDCPDIIQQGHVQVTIPAGQTDGQMEVRVFPCPGMNVQASGGPADDQPVIINAIVHQDSLILTVHRLEPLDEPLPVLIWWDLGT